MSEGVTERDNLSAMPSVSKHLVPPRAQPQHLMRYEPFVSPVPVLQNMLPDLF